MPRVFRIPRPNRTVLVALMALALAFPLGVLASHQFDDVPDSNQYHADIDAIADVGVTSGCDANSYCPDAAVTRGQMAAFLNRLGALAAGKTPVVNAKTSQLLDGFDANSISRVAYTATEDAPQADGTILSVSITAPVRGWYSITGSFDSYRGASDDSYNCQLNMDGDYVAGSIRYVDLTSPGDVEQDCTTNAGIATCGGASTITLSASGLSTTFVDAGSLQVVFTPFSGTGAQPSIFGCSIIILPSPPDARSQAVLED